jgi:acetyl esterase
MSRSKDRVLDQLLTGLDVQDNVETGRHGGIPTRTYRSRTLPESRTLMWLHGGALSHGGLDRLESHAVAAALAQRGITVVAVDYRRVPPWSWMRDSPPGDLPGIRFPVPVEDVMEAYAAVAARTSRVALGGASAVACLAAGATLRMTAEDRLVPPGLVLAYGTFHAHLPPLSPHLRPRIRGRHGLAQFRPTTLRRMNHNYAGSETAMRDAPNILGGRRS